MSEKVTVIVFHKNKTGKYKVSMSTALKLAKLLPRNKMIPNIAVAIYLGYTK